MTYRVIQWSTGNVGRHALRCIARHPDLELVGLWVHCADKAGKDAGELAGIEHRSACIATNDVDALLALDADCVCYTATADLRPREAIADMARIARVGQERRVELGRAARVTRRTSSPDCAARSKTRARARACRASRRASTRAGRTTSCRSCSPARASTSTTLRVMEIVNYATYAQPTVLFDTMGFGQAARRDAAAAASPACCRSRGAAR